ncbi:MAG: RelA/SpoT family protein [Candidatus Eisenbacteria bacterium]|nr:RelA/SpoT family protein [Candidatus Eisenbacteria bacterium]
MEAVTRTFEAFLAEVQSHRQGADLSLLQRAFEVAARAHGRERRVSGEPFMTHPLATAEILADLLRRGADPVMLAAALLHDTLEDTTTVTKSDLAREFGEEVAELVDGVTKIGDLPFRPPEVTQSETYRKMLLSMSRDIRVILIKLADRLHNMRTLDALEPERRQRIAQETLDIYAPIAHRLGIARFKWELEDLAFKHLDPETYRRLVRRVAEKRESREAAIGEVMKPLRARLAERGIAAEVTGRAKHLRSIWQKMQRLEAPFEEIYDLLGVRILTESHEDCYRVLGLVHEMYTPVDGRFRDYIAMPKGNLYQSLHTTVIIPGEKQRTVEIQIRTHEMHLVSELGIAAHYRYKEGSRERDPELQEKLGEFIIQGTSAWQDAARDPEEFVEFLKTALYQDEVYVFTPKGGLKRLPRGATPIDFAYMIHTDVGHHCVGARVNGRLVPLRYQLRSGQVVEIITNPHGQPSEGWLKQVATAGAKGKIRRWLAQQRLEDSVRLGREILQRELRRRHLRSPAEKELEDLSQSFGLADAPLLLAKIGQGDLSIESAMARLYPQQKQEAKRESALQKIRRFTSRDRGVRLRQFDGVLIRVAQCCQPIPGDRVIGIITKGRGLSVHRIDCPNTFDDRVPPERKMEVEWDVEPEQVFLIRLVVTGADRTSLLADVAAAIGRTETNIVDGSMASDGEGEARGSFVLEVKNLGHVGRVVGAVRRVSGVRTVERAGVIEEPEQRGS